MKPRGETGRNNLFKARLDQIIDMRHPRVLLAQQIDWRFFEQGFGAVYSDGSGSPPLQHTIPDNALRHIKPKNPCNKGAIHT
jgi:hypothetical protein